MTSGDLALNVNRDGLKAEGTAEIGGIPVGLTWNESFTEANNVRTQYEVRATLDAAAREQIGIAAAPYVTGPVGLGLTYSLGWDDVGAGAAEIDLSPAALSWSPLAGPRRRRIRDAPFFGLSSRMKTAFRFRSFRSQRTIWMPQVR